MSEASLYERLGGEAKIREIAATIFDLHTQNDVVKARYVNSDRDQVVQRVFEFLSSATGGPHEYTGADMLTAHRGMNISNGEYFAVLEDIIEALQQNGVGQREQEELLLANFNLRDEIISV